MIPWYPQASLPVQRLQPSQPPLPHLFFWLHSLEFLLSILHAPGPSSGSWTPVVLDAEPPMAGPAPAGRVTQQPWGSTPILLTGWLQAVKTSFCFPHPICSMWSWMCLTPIFDLRDPHHFLREGFLTLCAPKPDPEVTTTFPQCT